MYYPTFGLISVHLVFRVHHRCTDFDRDVRAFGIATILTRKRKNGSLAFQAQIVIKRNGVIAHREQQTFDKKQAAFAWAEKRESELNKPGGVERANADDPTLADVIDVYIRDIGEAKLGKTKAQVLATTKGYPIAKMRCSAIGSADISSFAQSLKVQPQTRLNYLSHLSSIFTVARPAWGFPLDRQAMRDALIACKKLGITGKSRERDRRPTLAELDTLMTKFGLKAAFRPGMVPMQKVVAFAIFSTRRQEEITRIEWRDLDKVGKRVLVRDMKNPGDKIGNNVWCDLPAEALAIVQTMPRTEARIFPYTTDALSANFTRACKEGGIEDLHFHDLRHEGVSRLLEMGYTIPRAAGVSGHRSWSSLKRYSHLRETGDKFAGWEWLPPSAR